MDQVKVVFQLPEVYHYAAETTWADVVDPGVYRLRNLPVLALHISIDDLFGASIRHEEDDRSYFDRVLERSSNVTHRLWLKEAAKEEGCQVAIDGLSKLWDDRGAYLDEIFTFSLSSERAASLRRALERELLLGEEKAWWHWQVSSSPKFPLVDVEDFLKIAADDELW